MRLSCAIFFTTLGIGLSCARSGPDAAPHPGDPWIDRYTGDVELTMHSGTLPSSSSVPARVDSVWMTLPIVFEQLGVPTTVVDRAGYRIGNTRFTPRRIEGKRLSQYIECGYGVTSSNNADTYFVTMSLATYLTAREDGGTLIQTSIEASARPREVSGNSVRCASKGTLETRILELVTAVLERGATSR